MTLLWCSPLYHLCIGVDEKDRSWGGRERERERERGRERERVGGMEERGSKGGREGGRE